MNQDGIKAAEQTITHLRDCCRALQTQIGSVLVGQSEVVRLLLTGLMSGGHMLVITTLMQDTSSGDGDRSCQLMVAGKPKPPFSLALAVGGVGASVSVPILVENVPISDK